MGYLGKTVPVASIASTEECRALLEANNVEEQRSLLSVDSTAEVDAKLAGKSDKSYVGDTVLVDGLSAVFTNVDNNIFATGIGVGVEIGDVIQIGGSVNNNGEFTVEVITDDNNVIVNQAHAGGTTSKSLVDETATVTVKLLCKWYLAPVGLGQGWVIVTASRASNVDYPSPENRTIVISSNLGTTSALSQMYVDGEVVAQQNVSTDADGVVTFIIEIPHSASLYKGFASRGDVTLWSELR